MQNSLFDLENRYASLSKTGDSLERLNAIIDWEIFRPILERLDAKVRKSNAGRKPTCRILMFKMLVLQRLNGLSDERLQPSSSPATPARMPARMTAKCWRRCCAMRPWGAKERLFERVLPRLSDATLAHLLQAAHQVDGIVKGLKQPDWPLDNWQALHRLALLLCALCSGNAKPVTASSFA